MSNSVFFGIFQMRQTEEMIRQKFDFVLREHDMVGDPTVNFYC